MDNDARPRTGESLQGTTSIPTSASHDSLRNPEHGSEIALKQVAEYLLQKKYLLTAFELLLECTEAGEEEDVQHLSSYFSNTTKFPPEELSHFEPNEAVSIQQLGKDTEHQLSLLQYELRVAKEDLEAMQTKLDAAEASVVPSATMKEKPDTAVDKNEASNNASAVHCGTVTVQDVVSVRDRQALNCAVWDYLMGNGFKLSGLTFQEEVGVNLNGGESLLALWQALQQTDKQPTEPNGVVDEAHAKAEEAVKESETVQQLREQLETAQKEKELLQAQMLDLSQQVLDAKAEAADNTPATDTHNKEDGSAKVDEGSGVGQQLQAVFLLLAERLPNIVPHMLIQHRQELLPLYITTIVDIEDQDLAQELITSLLTLIKKPTPSQAAAISLGCAELASCLGINRSQQLLVPSIVKQSSSKQAERRALVALVCGQVSLRLPEAAHLLIPEAMQLAEDVEDIVRLAAVEALDAVFDTLQQVVPAEQIDDLVVRLCCDQNSDIRKLVLQNVMVKVCKHLEQQQQRLQSMIEKLLAAMKEAVDRCPCGAPGNGDDTASEAPTLLRTLIEPFSFQFSSCLGAYGQLLPLAHGLAEQTIPAWGLQCSSPPAHDADARLAVDAADAHDPCSSTHAGEGSTVNTSREEDVGANHVEETDDQRSDALGASEQLDSTADPQMCPTPLHGDDDGPGVEPRLHAALDQWLSTNNHAEWDMVDALALGAVPALLCCARCIQPTADAIPVRMALADVLRQHVQWFGCRFTLVAVVPLLLSMIEVNLTDIVEAKCEHVNKLAVSLVAATPESRHVGRITLLPLLLSPVLPACGQQHMTHVIHQLFTTTLNEQRWALLYEQDVVDTLQVCASTQGGRQQLIPVLERLLTQDDTNSKLGALVLFRIFNPPFSAQQMVEQIVPAAVQLLGDPSSAVRAVGLQVLGDVYSAKCDDSSIVQGINTELEKLLRAGSFDVQLEILVCLTSHVPRFNTMQLEFVLKQIQWQVSTLDDNNSGIPKNSPRLNNMAASLLQALATIHACKVSDEALRMHHLAGLLALQQHQHLLPPQQSALLDNMLAARGHLPSGHVVKDTDGSMAASSHRRSTSNDQNSGHLANTATPQDLARAVSMQSQQTFKAAKDFLQRHPSQTVMPRRMHTFLEKAQSLSQRRDSSDTT